MVHIRLYEQNDREQFLTLYEAVWGRRKSQAWFSWRFEANPYREDVRMAVAEEDGQLVGAEPLLPFRLRAGSATVDAYQPVDWIVHPDHRREGVFTRMTERLLEGDDDAELLFNFPSDALLPGLEKAGWRVVGDVPTRYRIQRPQQLVSDGGLPAAKRLARSGLTISAPAVKRTLRLLDRTAPSADGHTVSRHTELPVDALSRIYEQHTPEQFHLARDEAYLRWRFANPNWRTTTYLASRDGTPVAGIVTAAEQVGGVDCVVLLDIQPMIPRDDHSAVRAALVELFEDHAGAGLVKAPAGAYSQLLRRYGFLTDTGFPLSRVATTSTQVVRPLGPEGETDEPTSEDAWSLDGRSLTDSDNWLLMPADLDIE